MKPPRIGTAIATTTSFVGKVGSPGDLYSRAFPCGDPPHYGRILRGEVRLTLGGIDFGDREKPLPKHGQFVVFGESTAGTPDVPDYSPSWSDLYGLIIEERMRRGLPQLGPSIPLTVAASGHSVDQAMHDAMSHTGSDGSSPFQRMDAAGYRYSAAGECVAEGYATPAAVFAAWMNSPEHRRILLDATYTDLGCGLSYAANGDPFWTADVGRPA